MNILNNKKIENSLFLGVHVHKNYHLCAYVHMCVQACGLGPECMGPEVSIRCFCPPLSSLLVEAGSLKEPRNLQSLTKLACQ